MQHPRPADLVDRSEEPEIAEHLSSCPSCRARWRVLTSDQPADLPGLEAARSAMAQARQNISQHLSLSLGIGPYDEPEDLEVGHLVERYRVEERLGRGGMGTVYRVRHVQLDSLHALKLLHRTSRSVRDRLVREGRAQSKLRHPNVVPVTDIVDVDGAPGLVMEFVDGPTLAKHLARDGRPTLADADRLAVEIIRGVAAAHEAGVAHRDLKPANVLLQPTGEGLIAKVTDFGLARELSGADDSELTRPQTPLGTPAYMAPEQIHDARRADERSDIFSLGAVLYELVTGKQAFTGPDVVSIYDSVRAGAFTPPQELVPDLPPRMVDTITRSLAVDPADRFPDCRAMLTAWRGGVLGNSLSDGPTTSTQPLSTAPSWTRWLLPAAGAAALAAAAVAAVGLAWPSSPDPTAAPLDAPAAGAAAEAPSPPPENLRERRLTAQSDDLQIYAVATAPDGQSFVYTDGRGIWSQPIDGGTATLLMSGGAYHNLDYFPGGTRIFTAGYIDDEPGAWTLNADGSDVQRVADATGHLVRLSPDGTRLAFSTNTGIWVSDLDGSNRVRVRSISTSDTTLGLTWSPTGQSVASVHAPATGDLPWLEINRVDGSATRRVVEHAGLTALSIAALTWLAPDTLVYSTSETIDEDVVATVFALDDAESGGSEPRRVHGWNGFFVLRLLPSADGSRFVTSRATATGRTALLDVGGTGELRPPTPEDWTERPVLWMGPQELVVQSERGGGGLFVYDLASDSVRLLTASGGHGLVHADIAGDDMRLIRVLKETEGRPVVVERLPLAGGEAERVHTLTPDSSDDKSTHRFMRCRGERCLVSAASERGVTFSWLDPDSGETSEPIATIPLTAKWMRWDLSPDGTELAVATSNPPRLTVRNVQGGGAVEWESEIDFPQAIAWRPDGSSLFLSGLVDSSQHPYRIVEVDRTGATETLWTSMSQNAYTIQPSPDGSTLALGLHTFDDDVWLVEGLLE